MKLFSRLITTRFQPSAMTKSTSLKGKDTIIGGSIIMPMANRTLDLVSGCGLFQLRHGGHQGELLLPRVAEQELPYRHDRTLPGLLRGDVPRQVGGEAVLINLVPGGIHGEEGQKEGEPRDDLLRRGLLKADRTLHEPQAEAMPSCREGREKDPASAADAGVRNRNGRNRTSAPRRRKKPGSTSLPVRRRPLGRTHPILIRPPTHQTAPASARGKGKDIRSAPDHKKDILTHGQGCQNPHRHSLSVRAILLFRTTNKDKG